jgi:hypothetical protein
VKVGKVVKATKEYERLDKLVNECQEALNTLDKTVEDESLVTGNTFTISGYSIGYLTIDGQKIATEKPKTKVLPVSLSQGLSALVRDGFKLLLQEQLVELTKQRDAIEV